MVHRFTSRPSGAADESATTADRFAPTVPAAAMRHRHRVSNFRGLIATIVMGCTLHRQIHGFKAYLTLHYITTLHHITSSCHITSHHFMSPALTRGWITVSICLSALGLDARKLYNELFT